MPNPNDDYLWDNAGPADGPGFTRCESAEEIRRALQQQGLAVPPQVQPQPQPSLAPTVDYPGAPQAAAVPFRPTRRPPMALLYILDDGREDGEIIRLRNNTLVIGRTAGDLLIPHDGMMSGRHAELSRVNDKGRWRWLLTDLQSSNGTYVKTTRVVLKHEQDFLLGGKRYRFDSAPQGADLLSQAAQPTASEQKTLGWATAKPADLVPSIVELLPQGVGQRYFLAQPDMWIGRDPAQCSLVIADDPMVSPRHAHLTRDNAQRWTLENAGPGNGIWVRVTRIGIEGVGHFQLGEQRFVLKTL
jgi:pSer/pThr/pTyr-binding forkhead associated (FHA) protein